MNLPSTTRLEAFSDAVFAIITTLLILEIRVPHLSELSPAAVLLALKPVIPKFISFTSHFLLLRSSGSIIIISLTISSTLTGNFYG
jgi:uncharacterized membrane protein